MNFGVLFASYASTVLIASSLQLFSLDASDDIVRALVIMCECDKERHFL